MEEHANVWLFLTHLSKDPYIIEVIVAHARSLFSEFRPIEFRDDIDFIQTLYDKVPEIAFHDGEFRSLKESRLRQLDKDKGESSDSYTADAETSEVLQVMTRLNMALRTLEVLGQLVKNFPGSLAGTVKFDLVKESYLLGLRTTEMFLGMIRNEPEGLVAAMVKVVREQYPQMEDMERLTAKIRSFVYWIIEGACYGMVKRISHTVGHSGLGQTYSEVYESIKTPAAQLVDMSIKLDTMKFPLNDMKRARKDFKSSTFCDRLLSRLVVHYLYIFPTDERLKQQICQELNIPIMRVRGIDIASGKQKMLPAEEQKQQR